MLTLRQKQALQYITSYFAVNGVMPTFEEIRDGLGMSSKSGVHRVVEALVERRHLRRIPNRARALEIIHDPHLPGPLNEVGDLVLAAECRRRGYVMVQLDTYHALALARKLSQA